MTGLVLENFYKSHGGLWFSDPRALTKASDRFIAVVGKYHTDRNPFVTEEYRLRWKEGFTSFTPSVHFHNAPTDTPSYHGWLYGAYIHLVLQENLDEH